MAKQSPVGASAQPDAADSPAAAPASAVGYGRVPNHTKWKRGQSGNPAGRRKGQRNVRTVLDEELNKRIRIREGNRMRSVTKLEAVIMTMINGALKGSAKAQASLIALLRSVGMTGEVPETTHREPFTADDEAVIRNYFTRSAAELKGTDAPESAPKTTEQTPTEQTPRGRAPSSKRGKP
jgi:Family of unknown function (DUF5681)